MLLFAYRYLLNLFSELSVCLFVSINVFIYQTICDTYTRVKLELTPDRKMELWEICIYFLEANKQKQQLSREYLETKVRVTRQTNKFVVVYCNAFRVIKHSSLMSLLSYGMQEVSFWRE